MPPFLPRELVEMILADPVLDYDKVTLARCCLLSKAHLHPFRRRLYRSLVIRLCETEDRLLDFELEPWQMVYDDATEQVLSKLRRHAHLRPLVQEIRMEVCSAGSMPAAVGTFTTTDAALATALHCCPYANSVFLPEDFDGQVTCRPMLEGMFRRPYQRVELLEDIALAWAFIHRHQDTLQEVSFGRFFEGIIPPSITASNGYGNLRLKNLRIPTLCTDAPSALMRRDALQTLLIPSRLSLTTLEITFDTRIFPDLADLPSLRHLLLHFEPTLLAASAAPAAVARSPNLQSLTVNGVHWMEPSELDSLFSPTKDGLAHHLPLSVTSLSLWSDTPKLDHLRNFLRFLPANSSLRHFEYPSPHWNERDIYEETDKEFTAKGIIMRRDGF